MPTLHTFRVEAVVEHAYSVRMVDAERAEALLIALADKVGPGQTAYDPQVARMEPPEGGLSASCLFPGGHAILHTYEAAGRLPPRYLLDVTATDPIDGQAVLEVVERRLGIPAASLSTRATAW